MYRHGRPDVVCVVSSEFLFLPPPFFAAPTVFLSHPRPFFPRFFLSLFRSPITYLRSSGAQLPLAAPRLHAFDTINEPRQRSEMKPISRFGFRARKKKRKKKERRKTRWRLRRTKAGMGALRNGRGHKGGRRVERKEGEGTYRQNSIGIFREIYLPAQWRGGAFSNKDKSTFRRYLFPVSFTSIKFDFHRVACTTTVPPPFQPLLRDCVDSVKSSLGMISKRDPLPFLCYAIGRRLASVIKRNDKCNYAPTVPYLQ